jgi:hypothetical protein
MDPNPNPTAQAVQTGNIPQEIRNYLENLIDDANITTLDGKMREDLITELYGKLNDFIVATIVNNLPPEKMEDFIKMNEEQRTQPEIEQFLQENISNSQELMANAFVEFRNVYLGNVAVSHNAPTNHDSGGDTPVLAEDHSHPDEVPESASVN